MAAVTFASRRRCNFTSLHLGMKLIAIFGGLQVTLKLADLCQALSLLTKVSTCTFVLH